MDNQIYLDNAATTQIKGEVFDVMLPYLKENYHNPSARYGSGRESRIAIEKARGQVADLINADPNEIYFTSGGTEANNWAFQIARGPDIRGYVLSDIIEHSSVYEAVARNKDNHIVMPDDEGFVDLEWLRMCAKRDDGLGFVSIMMANNEVGSVNPVKEIAEITHSCGAYFHTDAVQALGNLFIDVKDLGIDLMSMSSHKIYGPKGVGALYIESTVPKRPLLFGGGQERGMRSGTENVAGIVGFGKACELAKSNYKVHRKKVKALRDEFVKRVFEEIPDVVLIGARDMSKRLPGHASLAFERVEAESLLMCLDREGICVSVGSACSSNELYPSRVIEYMGVPDNIKHSVVRFTFGDFNTKWEIPHIVEALKKYVSQLRTL